MTAEGKFCERCGKSLPPATHVSDGQSGPEPSISEPFSHAVTVGLPPVHPTVPVAEPAALRTACDAARLEMDTLCILFEETPGFLRFRFNPGTTAENVLVTLENPLTGAKTASREVPYLQGGREITVPVPPQPAGAFVWYLSLAYEAAGRKRRCDGEVQMVVVRPREAQKAAEQLTVTINNNITNGNASDVHVSQHAVDELSKLATAENPFDELRKIVLSGHRVWAAVSIDDGSVVPTLPIQPIAAVRESITLDLGRGKLHFFAGRTIRFGRKRETNDFVLRPPEGVSDDAYRAVGRAQCCFEHNGDKAVIHDGQFDAMHVVKPSSFGTYWNDVRMSSLQTLAAGDSGVVSFSGAASAGALAMNVKVCRPIKACKTCPHANRTWCGDGRRPTLMLARRDGIDERFVTLWSCFPLEEADPSFEGVVIFRKNGGFAWRRGRRCGWFVPGTVLQTDFGQVTVS